MAASNAKREATGSTADAAADPVSVLSMNLRFGLAEDGANGWRFRRHCLPDLFARHRADVIALQEVNDFQAQEIRSLLTDFDVIGWRRPAPRFWQSNLLFYHRRWRCRRRDHFYLSATPQLPSRFADSRWPRQCTLGLFSRSRQRLICISTHFDFDAGVQVRSARLILHRLDREDPDVPVLLMGDFNATAGAPCHRVFTEEGFSGADGARKWRTAFRDAFADNRSGTFHGFSGRSDGRAIDWILYRGGVHLLASRVIRTPFRGRYPSDHFPLSATFAFTGSEPPVGM
jgi:endonuclease/exonuclease/phosphatase family metal-dependent hydrolase